MSFTKEDRIATLDDLARIKDRAELIAGRIIVLPLMGHRPGQVVGEIVVSLHDHARATGRGEAFMSRLAYAVPRLSSGRESFSPNASFYNGPPPADPISFVQEPPTFAVEVRGADDYGPTVERAIAAKRLDYFAAGTLVVWDVNVLGESILSYRAEAPEQPITYLKGQLADAEPAVPGWRMPVDDIFA